MNSCARLMPQPDHAQSRPAAVASASPITELCPLLAGLPEALLRQIGHRRRLRRFLRGDLLARSGDRAVDLLIVKEGALKASVPGHERTGPSRLLQRGDLCCEIALFDDTPMTMDVRAVTDGSVLALDGRDVMAAVRQDHAFAQRVIRHVCGQTRRFEVQVQINHTRPAEARLASQLLTLASLQAAPGARISQGTLADLIGVSRETVCRILQRWRAAGLIDDGDKGVALREPSRIEEIVEGWAR